VRLEIYLHLVMDFYDNSLQEIVRCRRAPRAVMLHTLSEVKPLLADRRIFVHAAAGYGASPPHRQCTPPAYITPEKTAPPSASENTKARPFMHDSLADDADR
jgi:hypothetical protein